MTDDDSATRPLRVTQVVTKLDVGGAQATVLALAEGLTRAGHALVLVAGGDVGQADDHWASVRDADFRVVKLPNLVRRISPGRDLRAVLSLARLLRAERPDVVHTHSSKAGVIGRLAARLARVPVVVHTVHGWSFRDYQGQLQRRIFLTVERLLARWCSDALVVVAESDIRLGLDNGIGHEGLYHVVRSGIDLAAFTPDRVHRDSMRRSWGVTADHFVVGTVTRFEEPKDTETLLRSVGAIGETNLRCVIVGAGSHEQRLLALREQLRLGDTVQFLGPRKDVAEIMDGFDLFVLSSSSEGLPRVVIEAMASGVPVVASDVGGVHEVVDPTTGWLVDPRDPSAMASAIAEAMGDDRERGNRSSAALLGVDEFSDAAMVSATAALYSMLLER